MFNNIYNHHIDCYRCYVRWNASYPSNTVNWLSSYTHTHDTYVDIRSMINPQRQQNSGEKNNSVKMESYQSLSNANAKLNYGPNNNNNNNNGTDVGTGTERKMTLSRSLTQPQGTSEYMVSLTFSLTNSKIYFSALFVCSILLLLIMLPLCSFYIYIFFLRTSSFDCLVFVLFFIL